jgi:hypothetical protein
MPRTGDERHRHLVDVAKAACQQVHAHAEVPPERVIQSLREIIDECDTMIVSLLNDTDEPEEPTHV